jgi:hypothetical protein
VGYLSIPVTREFDYPISCELMTIVQFVVPMMAPITAVWEASMLCSSLGPDLNVAFLRATVGLHLYT